MPDVTVSCSNKKISVDKNSVDASVSKAEKVTWTCSDGPFQIEFKSGPHPANPRTTQSGSTWVAESGPFAGNRATITYGISAPNFDTLDPEIQVIP
jgi:hypothetical protein